MSPVGHRHRRWWWLMGIAVECGVCVCRSVPWLQAATGAVEPCGSVFVDSARSISSRASVSNSQLMRTAPRPSLGISLSLSLTRTFALALALLALATAVCASPLPRPANFADLALFDANATGSSSTAIAGVAFDAIATPTSTVDPLETAETLPSDLLLSLNVSSAIAGVIAILSGVVFLGFGHRLFKPLLFLGGFYFFAVVTFCIIQNVSYKLQSSISEYVYLILCLIFGVLGGLLLVCVWKLGFFFLGALGGYFLANLLLVALHATITSSVTRWVILVVFALVFGFLVLWFELPILIGATALIGSYILFVGIDVFAGTGFLTMTVTIVSSWSVDTSTLSGKWIYMLVGCVVVALLGMAFQFHQVRQNGWKHQALGMRDQMYKPVPRKGENYQNVPY
ncbi:hypothetical protein HDU83_002686 [Entophlyctis luteolus]|nr:hypothetical protein HDU83_002686 [Entophlyctis luteolus]KAJ3389229.1 hypothetical protein HDU84_008967 [Entophlyctis sp. JEL0112]